MNATELNRRLERAQTEPFIIATMDEGYRVASAFSPATAYIVSGIPDSPTCSCPDFERNTEDPEWRCKHILAVLNRQNGHPAPGADSSGPNEEATPATSGQKRKRSAPSKDDGAQLVLKRSVSPDGRIDSLSVELSCPVGKGNESEVKDQAVKLMALQSDIARDFLNSNGKPTEKTRTPKETTQPTSHTTESVAAKLLVIRGMNTQWGRRLYIQVQIGDQLARLFGAAEQLSGHISDAGFAHLAQPIVENRELNLPCRITTKPSRDGRYINVERVMPERAS